MELTEMDKPGRSFLQKVDIPAILGQFLINLRLEDLVIELEYRTSLMPFRPQLSSALKKTD